MGKVLVVDDDLGIQKQLKWSLTDYNVVFADDRQSAIAQLRRFEPSVVTLDLGLPPDPANASEGLKTLEEIMALSPRTNGENKDSISFSSIPAPKSLTSQWI